MTLIRLPVRQNTPDWLAMRRTGVAASELPIITGNRDGLMDLWAVKTGLLDDMPVDEATQELYDLGHELEPVIAHRYTVKSGRPVKVVSQMVRHPDIEWAFASLDRVSAVRGERLLVELKFTPYRQWPTDGPEPVPAAVQDQVQWQLMTTGYPLADVAVLVGGRVDIHTIEPDPAYQATLLSLAEWFRDLVLRREPPPVDGSESTRRTLSRLFPREHPDKVLRPTKDVDAVAQDLYRAKVEAKAAADRQDTLENALRAMLGDAEYVEGTGYRISWKRNADSSRIDWKGVAADLADRASPFGLVDPEITDLVDEHTETREGPRVLRVTYRDEAASWV